MPWGAKSYQEILRKFRTMDVEWCLAGTVDAASDTFALHHVTIIDDSA